MVTAIATLVLVNLLELESISTAGSVGFLLIFGVVNLVGYRLAKETGSNKIIPMVGFVLCILATFTLINQQYSTNSTGVLIALGIILGCFLMEWIYKKTKKK